jgi:thiol-disulfide isomerase/thioredoxin
MEPSRRRHPENRGAQASPDTFPESALAALVGATGWLNSAPVTAAALRGRAVLIQFWTFTCINWLRTLPYVRAWNQRYASHGLVVIGVHTPEFDVERDIENVHRAADHLRVDYPIAVDSDYTIWDAFGNRYWPAIYLIDAMGRIRHHRFGEGDEARSERILQRLLTEAGARGVGTEGTVVDPRGVEAAADWADVKSWETYLGYERAQNCASLDDAAWDTRRVYTAPERLRLNHWGLSGDWTLRRQAAVLNRAGGRIVYRFHARDLHLVMGPIDRGSSVRFRVCLDGGAPGTAHGVDVDERGDGAVTAPRLYQLIRQPDVVADRNFDITFLDPGIRAYAVTFG